MDANKDSKGEPTSPNPIPFVAEIVKKTLHHSKNPPYEEATTNTSMEQ